jgi:type II secretory pathway component GspD/PulD (secretin)
MMMRRSYNPVSAGASHRVRNRSFAIIAMAAISVGTFMLATPAIAGMQYGKSGGATGSISMSFNETDIGQVLKAISLKTGANIVYVSKAKAPVTLNITGQTPEEAIRSAVASAGLVYRRVGGVYVVASATDMRQALEPYGSTVNFTMDAGDAVKALPGLQLAVPYATARTVGNKIVFTGTFDDIRHARDYIDDFKALQVEVRPVTQNVKILNGSPAQVAKTLAAAYPGLSAVPLGETGGMVMLTGPGRLVTSAAEMASKLDLSGSEDNPNAVIYRVYELRYTSAPVLSEFLKKAAPEVEAFVGPEAYSPPRAKFNPLGSSSTSSSGSSGSGSSNSSNSGGTQGSSGQGQSSSPDRIVKEGDRSRTVVLKGPQAAVERAIVLMRGLDRKPQQVLVQVQVVETAPTFTRDLGIDWNVENKSTITETSTGSNGIGFGTFQRTTPFSFTGLLKAKISSGEAKLLADPRVQVIDNDEAFIFIGDTIRAKVSQSAALGTQTVTIEEFPIGIILLIRPRVNADGNITLHVNPVVSSVTSVNADNLPQTSSREAETTIIVKDGQTVGIGGLIRDEFRKTITEVPFLSKLPVIGELFRYRSTTKNRTDIIVTITPRIIPDPEANK